MQTIYLITTGGTIEKSYSEQNGTVLNSVCKIERYLKQLRLPDCDVHIVPLMNKDSLEMTWLDLRRLASEMILLLPNRHPVIILHGTDTMVETGVHIQRIFAHQLKVPVILTGAMSPLGFEGSDGLQNLTESLLAARLLGPGVFVVIHGQVIPVSHARKDRERGTFVRTDLDKEVTEVQGKPK
jgi:L-asparaginase